MAKRKLRRNDNVHRVDRAALSLFVVLIFSGVAFMSPVITGNVVGSGRHLGLSVTGIAIAFVGLVGMSLYLRFRHT